MAGTRFAGERGTRGSLASITVAIAVLVLASTPVLAHPLGNFTINHYTAIDARPDGLGIAYVLDMAEIPTFQEIGRLDEAAMRRHVTARLTDWDQSLHLSADGVPIPLTLREARAACLPGAGGLPILRIEEDLWAGIPSGGARGVDTLQTMHFVYRDANFPERVGWKEIVVTGRSVKTSSVPSTDRGSRRLRTYPVDLLKSPPDDSVAQFSVRAEPFADAGAAASPTASSAARPAVRLDLSGCRGSTETVGSLGGSSGGPRYVAESTAFGTLFKRLTGGPLNLQALIVVLLGAFVLGAYHAMMPGHGKAILAAFFIGSRGTPGQAVLLGTLVTLTHTTGVFLVGFATLAASRYVLPEKLYPWLSMLSGVMLLGVGASLFVRRMNALGRSRDHAQASHDPDVHYDHHHGHIHHEQHHDHHCDRRDHSDNHPHNPRHHHHLPAGETIQARDLITLGVTGGMLPCPSALVVMLAAISVGQVGFGLALITAFSLGLATVLTAGGILMLYSRTFVTRVMDGASGEHTPPLWRKRARPLLRQLPVMSAAVVAVLGLVIVVQTVMSAGLIR